jgi:flagellar hook-associated protein 1 FlgK
MPGIYSVMDMSRWALHANTRALDTVSHNVANANTPGYSRQETVLSTRTPQWSGEGWYGNGVQVANVIQHVDTQLQGQLTDNSSRSGWVCRNRSQCGSASSAFELSKRMLASRMRTSSRSGSSSRARR